MNYNHSEVEKKWQLRWEKENTFTVKNEKKKPKYYVLDMFPYPSGSGLHVGHPLGYIASDIIARYKRNKGFNVLHPIGFDSFGLPAEQYAILTGKHPQKTTKENSTTFKTQLKRIGLSFDWERELSTSHSDFFLHTQETFIDFFSSWYNKKTDKAEPVSELVKAFESSGNVEVEAHSDAVLDFSAKKWNAFTEKKKEEVLGKYRLAFLKEEYVNWCPKLCCVLSNDEIKDGFSERGGHPVYQKKMKQWMLRITAYAHRLLSGLETVDFPNSIVEIQKNWIGKSHGAEVFFTVENSDQVFQTFTTRPDTIFGVTFIVLAPESELVPKLTKKENLEQVEEYIANTLKKSQRDRISQTKEMTGCFTGTYAINPINKEKIPVWVSDYVLADYGTGVVMGVPGSDDRDYRFASTFSIEIRKVISVQDKEENEKPCVDSKDGTIINSGFLDGLSVQEGIKEVIKKIEEKKVGNKTVNFRLRDAIFARQRYWGEPIPIYFKDGIPYALPKEELPLELPKIESYLPTESGEPPLARAKSWTYKNNPLETSTMPGWAGSSWYFIRYMDPHKKQEIAGRDAINYWNQVDFYLGGAEHATGHLIYSRFWTKFLYDRGKISFDEPFKKLVNQGMIQGKSAIAYKINNANEFVSFSYRKDYDTIPIHVDVSLVDEKNRLDKEAFKTWRKEYENAKFILEGDDFFCESQSEKMSKSLYNVVNPDDVIEKYGADAFRMYEMFLGPIEHHKPWDERNIEGTYRFINKIIRLFYDKNRDVKKIPPLPPKEDEQRIIHKSIKAITIDIERFSLNTCISHLMICVNELSTLKLISGETLSTFVVLLSPFAPHLAEELWELLGNDFSVCSAPFPKHKEEYLKESSQEYPIAFNGKTKLRKSFNTNLSKEEIEEIVRNDEDVEKKLSKKKIIKVIVVPERIINIVHQK